MEKEVLKAAIMNLKNVINLKEVVTDASSSIIEMMVNYTCKYLSNLSTSSIQKHVLLLFVFQLYIVNGLNTGFYCMAKYSS